MLGSVIRLNSTPAVRRCGAHYTDALEGCKAPDQKKFQKIQLVDSVGLIAASRRLRRGCPSLKFPVSIRLCQTNPYIDKVNPS